MNKSIETQFMQPTTVIEEKKHSFVNIQENEIKYSR